MKIRSATLSAKNDPASVFSNRNASILIAFFIIGAVFWIYWPSLRGGWIGDDVWYVTTNPLLREPDRLWKAWFAPGSWVEFYPIEETVQWFQWQLWHRDTLGYHLTNVVLHIGSAFLLWHFFRKFGLRFAWLSALLFAVHPEAVDSVSEIVELKNSLSLPPFIIAMCLYMDYEETKSRRCYLWSLTFFMIAMLCKITMMAFPGVILLYSWWKRGRITWENVKASIPFFVIALALVLTTLWSGQIYAKPIVNWDPSDHPLGGPLFRLVLSGQVIAFYFSRIFFPLNPMPEYYRWPVDPSQWIGYLPWVVIVLVFAYLWTKRASWGRHALLGLGYFLIMLSPFIALFPISYMNVTWILDHMLYVPMVGLIGLVAAACGAVDDQLPLSARRVGAGVLGLVVGSMAFQSHLYSSKFVSEEALDRYNLQFVDNPQLHNNLAFALSNRHEYAEDYVELEHALRWVPNSGLLHNNLGSLYYHQGQMDNAIDEYYLSIKYSPNQGLARAALGDTLFEVHRVPEAIVQYQAAVGLGFERSRMYGRIGEALFQQGKTQEGLNAFRKAVDSDPTLSLAQYNLAKALCNTGQIDEGIKRYRKAIELFPGYAEAHNNLGIALARQGQTDLALVEFEIAVQDNPNYTDALNNLQLMQKMRAQMR